MYLCSKELSGIVRPTVHISFDGSSRQNKSSNGETGIRHAINQSRRRPLHFPDGRNNKNTHDHIIVAKASINSRSPFFQLPLNVRTTDLDQTESIQTVSPPLHLVYFDASRLVGVVGGGKDSLVADLPEHD